ncbi:GNAT family N-acetyltransferase [Brachybacterium nesterenkovii]|uniref:Bll0009 putative acetyltransferase n=1 Tax=Brachybacterium nesterenkovii TaxID=47847 RepID=A0A1X6X0L0_9MICO|nr:GNAT family N-acetyltransferase [Brachybacterium nesterenkovii]SLM91943.1 bll0009; putative acetyltransferase [Brachybacterium nesterenkovii]
MSIVISPAAEAELPECARLITRALIDDAVMHRLVPGAEDRLRRMTAALLAELRGGAFAHGVVDTARNESGGPLLGVAAWVAPRPPRCTPRRAVEHVRGIRAVGLRRMPAAIRADHRLTRDHPTMPHWYLEDIAVAEGARGMGVGSALIEHGLARVDADALPAYLESTTPASRRLYARHGFGPLGVVDLGGGATATTMLRPAAI